MKKGSGIMDELGSDKIMQSSMERLVENCRISNKISVKHSLRRVTKATN